MAYPINKKKLPRKKTDIHIMNGIIRAVNEKFHISNVLLQIDIVTFDALVNHLIKENCIKRVKGNDKDNFNPEDFIVTIHGAKVCQKIKTGAIKVTLGIFTLEKTI